VIDYASTENSATGLDEFLDRLQPVVEALSQRYEIIFVDDDSHGGSLQKLAQVRANNDRIM
jgi:glycosyltransferase involved in cell wall biosynthesis